MSRTLDSPCDGCLCSYCRWHGSDNCLYGGDGDGSCFACGERWRQKRPLYQCEGYTRPPVQRCEHKDCFSCPYDDCIIDMRELMHRERDERRKKPAKNGGLSGEKR